MDARYVTASLLACFSLAGCQSGGNTELMERDLRLQEDRIYQLEDELARCCQEMQLCQQENEALRSGQTPKTPQRTPRSSSPPAPTPPPGAIPQVELEMPSMPETPPAPSPATPPINGMPSLFEPPRTAPSTEQPSAMRIVKPKASPARPADAKWQVAEPPPEEERPPVRMRFATTVDESAPPMAGAAPATTPRTAVGGSAAPRRPQWSPYR